MEKALLNQHVTVRTGAYLPHWTLAGATYAVCFRLADSLPAAVVAEWKRERTALLAEARAKEGGLTPIQRERLDELFSTKVERFLDAGYGACSLRDEKVVACVADAIRHFDGERYRLAAWCVMPNHVHVVVQPMGGCALPQILKSWKGFSAVAANRGLGRRGEFWQTEYYDHLVRDEADFVRCVRYVVENPLKAGLQGWKWVWASESAKRLLEAGAG